MRLLNRISLLSPVKHKNPKVVVEFLGAINSPLFQEVLIRRRWLKLDK
jgi:hypothetical protein